MCKTTWLDVTGFPATLEIKHNLENDFPIVQSGKTQGMWEKHKTSGKTQGMWEKHKTSGKTQGMWEKHKKNQGKLRECGKNTKHQGKLREFVTVTQKGKVFASLGYVRLVPCVEVVFID